MLYSSPSPEDFHKEILPQTSQSGLHYSIVIKTGKKKNVRKNCVYFLLTIIDNKNE